MENFEKVKSYLMELEYDITYEDTEEELVIVEKEENGIKNLVIDCEDPILVIEQFLFEMPQDNGEVFKNLLQKNREIIHGAFCLSEDGKKVLFRDTLQLDSLDFNELEGSINSLSLLLGEFYEDLIAFSRNEKPASLSAA